MHRFEKFLLCFSLSSVASCSHYSHKYVLNPDEIDREQFETDFRQCEQLVENGGNTTPSKGEIKEVAKQHAVNSIPVDSSSVATQAALGITQIVLGSLVKKKQLVRRCLKLKGYEVKWLRPEYDIPMDEDRGHPQIGKSAQMGKL